MSSPRKTVTIFVCVKVRDSEKSSCGGCGARKVLDQLRANLSSAAAEHIIVRPSGCLKKCKKGPAVVVFGADHEPLKKPPKKAWKRAHIKFKRVQPEDAKTVLAAAQTLLQTP